MRRDVYGAVVIVVACLLLQGACSVPSDTIHEDQEQIDNSPLTASAAKDALIELFEGSENVCFIHVLSEIRNLPAESILDNQDSRFQVRVSTDGAWFTFWCGDRVRRYNYKGEFTKTPSGKWVASITHEEKVWKD